MEFEVVPSKGKIDVLAAHDNPRGKFRLFVQCGFDFELAFEGKIGCLADILVSNSLLTETIGTGRNVIYIVHPNDLLNNPDLVK